MKSFQELLDGNRNKKKIAWDEKSIFFAFMRVIRAEYGAQGEKKITPTYLKNKKLFIDCSQSVWAHELSMRKDELVKKINQELGSAEVEDIKISRE